MTIGEIATEEMTIWEMTTVYQETEGDHPRPPPPPIMGLRRLMLESCSVVGQLFESMMMMMIESAERCMWSLVIGVVGRKLNLITVVAMMMNQTAAGMLWLLVVLERKLLLGWAMS